MRIYLATTNAGKAAELRGLLAPLGVAVELPPTDAPIAVEEDRPDFAGNAAKKAAHAAMRLGAWCLADDSGLEVDALGGRPGVHSARFAGPAADAAANNARLLRELADVPDERRGAGFRCALALARPDGTLALAVEGRCRGRILTGTRGDAGFGYDPLFLFDEPGAAESGRSFAELSRDQKGRVSHRGRALRELARRLPAVLEGAAAADSGERRG